MPSPFNLSYFDPPAHLERHVLALFHFTWDERVIIDRHPGALGQLVMFPYGSGEAKVGGQLQRVEGEAHLFSGFSVASPFIMDGPWHAYGASLSPLGWAALSGQPANEYMDRFLQPAELLGDAIDKFSRETNDLYRAGKLSGEEACELLAEWIAPRLGKVPPAHEAVIERTIVWLGTSLTPDVDALFSQVHYSRRQTERLVERYFGFPPAALARKLRAVRAASMLGEPDLSDRAEAEIADAFFDQPHMVREIRRYCGYTPTRLGGPAEPLFLTMLRMKNFDRLQRLRAIGLREDANDSQQGARY